MVVATRAVDSSLRLSSWAEELEAAGVVGDAGRGVSYDALGFSWSAAVFFVVLSFLTVSAGFPLSTKLSETLVPSSSIPVTLDAGWMDSPCSCGTVVDEGSVDMATSVGGQIIKGVPSMSCPRGKVREPCFGNVQYYELLETHRRLVSGRRAARLASLEQLNRATTRDPMVDTEW